MFFQEAFANMNEEQKESFCQTVFMHDPSDYAALTRKAYYATKFKSMGKKVYIGTGVKIVNPQYISIGENVCICDGVTLIAKGEGGITIGNNVYICDRVYLDTQYRDTGYIQVGDHVYIGTGTTLFGHKGLEIGDHALLAQNITLTPYSHIFEDPNANIITQDGHCAKVTVGRDAYIGMGCCILYGGNIGDGAVVGAGSVVTKPVPAYAVAVGNPARVIRKRG